MKKGSITIFSLMVMILTSATLLTLLEGTRYREMQRLSQLQTQSALESVFAGYNSFLWKEYHLLVTDQNRLEERLLDTANAGSMWGTAGADLLNFEVKELDTESYTLLTDDGGRGYIYAVSSYMKENILYETIKALYNEYKSVEKITEEGAFDPSAIEDALKDLEKAKSEDNTVVRAARRNQNLLMDLKSLLEKGVLELVMEDSENLSKMNIETESLVSNRELKTGLNSYIPEIGWVERILMQQYLTEYMSNYRDQRSERALNYELEYLIGGKTSDRSNLITVVTQLLELRAAANLAYLLSDQTKMEEAGILATAIAGASLNPILIETVRIALLTGWSFAESVLDVRALLSGKRITLIKNRNLWTLDLEDIASITNGFSMAKECELGLSYENYAAILLLFQKEETLALRAMDMQELAMQKAYENPSLYMDEMLIRASVEVTYVYKPLLWNPSFLQRGWLCELHTGYAFGYSERQVQTDVS